MITLLSSMLWIPTAGAGEADLVYSNTGSNLYFPPGVGRRIADDISTVGVCACTLDRYNFTVTGNGDGTGEGFTVEYGLYEGCPNDGGTLIVGTEGIADIPDNGTHMVVVEIPDGSIQLPPTVWLAVEFNNTVGGWLVGEPPEIGFSLDVYDFPSFPCTANVGASLFASFAAQVYCEPIPPVAAANPLPPNGAEGVPASPTLIWNGATNLNAGTDGELDPDNAVTPENFEDATEHPDFFLSEFKQAIARGEIEDPSGRPMPDLPPAQDFFANTAGFGPPPVGPDDLYVFEDSADLLANPFSLGQAQNLMAVATNEVIATYGDSYDFVAFFLNFPPDPGSQFGGAFYSGLQNDTQGIGLGNFNNLNAFGIPSEKLQGWVMMWNQANWPAVSPSVTQLVLGQEFEHRFAMFLFPMSNAPGGTPRPFQGQDDGLCGRSSHWNFRVDGQGSGMEIAEWVGADPATWNFSILSYNTDIPGSVFSYPDLYLMGYVSPDEMDQNSSELRYMDENFNCSSPYNGPISTWDSSDIIASNGVRVPDSFLSQKNFSTAWIVIHRPGAPPTTTQLNRMASMLNQWNDTWVVSTLGRGVMTNVLEPPDPCNDSFDVYVDTVNPPLDLKCSNLVQPMCEPGLLASETTHFWQVVTQKPGAEIASDVWSFTTEACGPPDAPTEPTPQDNASNVELVTELTWLDAQNLAGGGTFCNTTFDVYFGQDSPPTTLICDNMDLPACETPILEPESTYFWQVNSSTPGGSEQGPVWTFTTRPCANPPTPFEPFPPNGGENLPTESVLSWNNQEDLLTFDNVGNGSNVDGLVIDIVTFSYDGTEPALVADDNFASKYIDLPAVIAFTPWGTLGLDFASSVYSVAFGYGFNVGDTQAVSVSMTLFDAEDQEIGTFTGGASNQGFGITEGRLDVQSEMPIARAELTFLHTGADVFVVDNIGYDTLPPGSAGCAQQEVASVGQTGLVQPASATLAVDRVSSPTNAGALLPSREEIRGMVGRSNNGGESQQPAAGSVASTGTVAGGIACPPTYDVFLGQMNPPTEMICSGVSATSCDPGPLDLNATYYWQVVAKAPGQSVTGDVWSFKTPCTFSGSVPEGCSIDAGQNIDPSIPELRQGWRIVTLQFACATAGATPEDFLVEVEEGDAPLILFANNDGNETTLELLEAIPGGQWTCFSRACTEGSSCLGLLPGDVDNSLVSDRDDITALIAALDGTEPVLPAHRVDLNRDNDQGPEDLLRLIDLLNGGGPFDAWYGEALNTCPN
jgi:hypothetical protein